METIFIGVVYHEWKEACIAITQPNTNIKYCSSNHGNFDMVALSDAIQHFIQQNYYVRLVYNGNIPNITSLNGPFCKVEISSLLKEVGDILLSYVLDSDDLRGVELDDEDWEDSMFLQALKMTLGFRHGFSSTIYTPPALFTLPTKEDETKDVLVSNQPCIVCWVNQVKCVVNPCGHVCMCITCTRKHFSEQRTCPVCRNQVKSSFMIYF